MLQELFKLKIKYKGSSEKTICPVLDYGIFLEACGSFDAANIVWIGMDALRWKIQSFNNRMFVEFHRFTLKLACHLPAGNMIIKWGFTTTEWAPRWWRERGPLTALWAELSSTWGDKCLRGLPSSPLYIFPRCNLFFLLFWILKSFSSSQHSMEPKNDTPDMPMPCIAGCGFYGNPIYNNMCSKCFKDHAQAKEKKGDNPLWLRQWIGNRKMFIHITPFQRVYNVLKKWI